MNRTMRVFVALAALIACGFFLYTGCAWNGAAAPRPEESAAPEPPVSSTPGKLSGPTASPGPVQTDQAAPAGGPTVSAEPREGMRSDLEIIREMIFCYNGNGRDGDARILELLSELRAQNADAAGRWERIMDLWRSSEDLPPAPEDVLPDGLPDTDELCIVALGYQLNPDGSIQQELAGRLRVVLASAERYPNALILCTGGGTAVWDKEATEAGKMAEWLIDNGVAPERIIVEDKSLSTAQNAMYSYEILTGQYPQVRQIAVITSDYHVSTGVLLFEAVSILRAQEPGLEKLTVVSEAAWHAPDGYLPRSFQAGELIELAGDEETAFRIYGNAR